MGTTGPVDGNYKPELAGLSPGNGWTAIQLDTTTTTDAVTGNPAAPTITLARIKDASGNAFGTTANPIATNQLVGTPVYATATGSAGATANVSLAAVAGKTTYINGFYVSVAHTASGTIAGQVTLSLNGGTSTHMNFLIAVSTTYPGLVEVTFPDPIPATAANTTIVITLPALTGGGVSSISAFGYQL